MWTKNLHLFKSQVTEGSHLLDTYVLVKRAGWRHGHWGMLQPIGLNVLEGPKKKGQGKLALTEEILALLKPDSACIPGVNNIFSALLKSITQYM